MAEGGENADDANPFTFKSFVSKKETTGVKTSKDDEVDIFDFTDESSQRKRGKPKKQILVVDEEEPEQKPKKTGKSENPFSFKKFLSSSSKKPTSGKTRVEDGKSGNNEQSREHLGGLVGDLPDFVQDHYSESITAGVRGAPHVLSLSQSPQFDLPDFTRPPDQHDKFLHGTLENENSSRKNSSFENGGFENSHKLVDENSDNGTVISDEEENAQTNQFISNLPDFLSNTVVGNNNIPKKSKTSKKESSKSRELDVQTTPASVNDPSELLLLRQENTSLKEQIEKLRGKKKENEQKIGELQQLLVEQKKKEVEETAVMEHAMEQVEQNLSDTTKRAVKAETTVNKLKQDMKTLQVEVKTLRGEQNLSGDRGLSEIKERTSYVAEQLSMATNTAETSLKQLLSGLDQLKLLSQVLTSVDKISENSTPDTDT